MTGTPGSVVNGLYVYNFAEQQVEPGDPVTFDQAPIPTLPVLGMSFISPSSIQFTLPGVYHVTYTALPQTANTTLALFLDNTEIPGSRYTAPSASESVNGMGFFILTAGQVPTLLTLRNVDNQQDANLQDGQQPNTVNASIFVQAIET